MSESATPDPSAAQLRTQVSYLEAEVVELRRRLDGAPGSSRALDQRLLDTQRSLAALTSQNERLASTLREARDQILTLKEEVDRLAQPPTGFGTDRKSTRLNSSHSDRSRMPSSA